jgi:hypothetical protein
LTTRSAPKISVSPEAMRKSTAPEPKPDTTWAKY